MNGKLGSRQMLVLQSHIEFDGTSQSWIPSSDWGALGMQKVWESLSSEYQAQKKGA